MLNPKTEVHRRSTLSETPESYQTPGAKPLEQNPGEREFGFAR